MKLTKGKTSRGVIVTAGKSGYASSVIVPGQGKVTVVSGADFQSAKSAAGSRLEKMIETIRNEPYPK